MKKDVVHILVLCSDCKLNALSATPKVGTAEAWERLLICDDCAAKRLAAMKPKVSTRA